MATNEPPAGHRPWLKLRLVPTKNHTPRRVERKRKPPVSFSKGERDFQLEDAYKGRKRRPRLADPSDADQTTRTASVIVPGPELGYESDVSSLTDLEDLEDIEDPFRDTDDAANGLSQPATSAEEQTQLEGGYQDTISALRENLDALQSRNRILEDEVARLTAPNTALACANNSVTEVSRANLHEKNEEIKALRRRLARTLDMVELTRPLSEWESFAESTGTIFKEMHTLGNYVAYVAEILTRIKIHDIQRLRTDWELSHEVANLIARTIASVSLLASETVAAFRALIFGFLREHVFEAFEPWNTFHAGSIMLRYYQEVIEQSISPDAVEKYHRAAVHLAITSRQFKEDFLPRHVETLSTKLLEMFRPLIQVKKVSRQLQRQLKILFRHAVNLRAACYPGTGIRYQLVQFLPGAEYDPEVMDAQTDARRPVQVPADGRRRFIKVCVHGFLKAHSVPETASGVELIEKLSCPFLSEVCSDGELVSEKATVILQ
ncbi:hypothetical protein BJX62DRAFT_220026 [Aspergillus germanicus]